MMRMEESNHQVMKPPGFPQALIDAQHVVIMIDKPPHTIRNPDLCTNSPLVAREPSPPFLGLPGLGLAVD
jgi:hypothetical protein